MHKYLALLVTTVLSPISSIHCAIEPIVQALEIVLPPTDQETSPEISDICGVVFDQIKANNYGTALGIVVTGLQCYPNAFALQTRLATVLGDYAEQFSGPDREKMLQKSKEIFIKLYSEAECQPKRELFYFKNEYFFRFSFHKEQYENGVQVVEHFWDLNEMSTDGYRGYYRQGVGAANYAKQLLLKGDQQLSFEYARKALVAWAQFFSYCNDYYNAYVHYGLALGILGHKQEMVRALQRGAELIHEDLNFHEFKEVIEFVDRTVM